MGAKHIGFTFSIVEPTNIEVTPVRQNVLNTFDLVGQMLSTSRLDGEENIEYKQRLMDVAVNPGGPIYEGVINNIRREFGYTKDRAFTINVKYDSTGDFVADSPRVQMLADRVVLYSNWRPDGTEVIDKEIPIYSPGDAGYFLDDLIAEINTSTCFEATIDSDARPNMHSTNLIRVSSDNFVSNDIIESDKKTKLSAELLVKGSLVFSDTNVFHTEVLSDPTELGEYYVDYLNGIVLLYEVPTGAQTVSYRYSTFPLKVDSSLVKVYTLQDEDFVKKLFIQETLESGEDVNALPNTEGSEVFHQLFKETKVFWGK